MATTRVHQPDSALIESVCARIRERLGEEDAAHAEEFARQYYRGEPPEDLAGLDPLDVYGAVLAHWSFGRHREPGTPSVRVYNPEFEQHGWQSAHTVVELVSDYLERSLPPEETTLVEQHLNFCDGCDWYLEQLKRTVETVGEIREEDIPADAKERLLGAFREWKRS